MTLDERGRKAASDLDQEIRRRVDPAASLRELHVTRDVPIAASRRPIMGVAFAVVIAVVIVLVVAFGALSSDDPAPSSKTYAFLPSVLPSGVHPAARLEGQTGTPSARFVRGVQYLATSDRRASLSVITARLDSPLDSLPSAVQVQIHGYPAQLSTLASPLNLDPAPIAVGWQEHGFTIEVHSVGLSVDEVLHVARGVRSGNRAQFDEVVASLPVRPTAFGLQPFSVSVDQLLTKSTTLATFEQPEGPGRLLLGTILYEGLKWRCAALIDEETATGQTASGGRCVAADRGFVLPTFLDDYPRVSFLLGSFPRSVRAVTVTRDNGERLSATLHDTGTGPRPIVAFVNLGIRPPAAQPDATVTVTDNTGKTIQSERVAT